MAEAAIEEIWNEINEVLDLNCGRFHIKQLCTRKWYLQAMGILFPFLQQEWNKIRSQIQSEQAAIDRILLILTQEGVIPEDYLSEIKGRNIVIADQETIMTLIQIIKELVEQALQDAEEDEFQQEGNSQGHKQKTHGEQNDDGQEEGDDENNYNFNEKRQQQQPLVKNKMHVTTAKADSEPDRDRDTHSVQGIGNQFDDEQQQGSRQSDPRGYANQQKGYNIYPQSASSSSKPVKATNYKSDDEDEQEHYLQQKLLKCKSQQQLKGLPSSKQVKAKKGQKVRALVSHPTVHKQYEKATTHAEKKMTQNVKGVITNSRKAFDKQNLQVRSPTGKQDLQRKKRQLNYFANSSSKGEKKQKVPERSMNKLKKLLKWKQANLKRQQRELLQQIEMKVQLKKQAYVKKINKLILNLQKQKMLDRKKDDRERRKKQKDLAEKRLMAIEHQYRDQMAMLHSKSPALKKGVEHLDHRTIIQGLEKDLKKQNEKQITMLKTRLRREEVQLDNDLEILQKEIVRAYKRN